MLFTAIVWCSHLHLMNNAYRLLLLLFLVCVTQSLSAQTGLIFINRALNGTQPVSRSEILSHTLVAVVENGLITRIPSWGTTLNPTGWATSDPMGFSGAQGAFFSGLYEMMLPGFTSPDFDLVFAYLGSRPGHPNLGIILNCKWEAWVFKDRADNLLAYGNPAYTPPLTFGDIHFYSADPYFLSNDAMWAFIRERLDTGLDFAMRVARSNPEMADILMGQYFALKGAEEIRNQNEQ